VNLVKQKLHSVSKADEGEKKHDVKTYHVIPRFNDWAVKRSGASRVTAVYKSKKEAIVKARELVEHTNNVKIVVHKTDGTIEKMISDKKTRGKAK
jgi:uncharacterized protein YdaT